MDITKEQLIEFGIELKREEQDWGNTCFLYAFDGINYVVLGDGTVITQEEDNICGPEFAIFPFNH
jgi:hypothetical protein